MQIVFQDGGNQSGAKLSGNHVGVNPVFHMKRLSRMKCLTLLRCNVSGQLTKEFLVAEARKLQSFAWAKSTKKALNSEQKTFISFCSLYQIDELPVDGDTLVLYAAYLVLSGRLKSVGSVKQYLSAVSTLHKMFGLECHTPSSYGPLRFTVTGIQRIISRPKRRMLPITPQILYNLLVYPELPEGSSWESKCLMFTLRVLYVFMFFSMLRTSNLIPPSRSEVDPLRQLTWGMVQRLDDGIVCAVRLSKTIQFQERVHQVPLSKIDNKMFCPVAGLDRLLSMRCGVAVAPDDLVFQVFTSKGVWEPLYKNVLVKVLEAQIRGMKLEPEMYRPHAFRHGGVQEALIWEPSLELIKLQSDHVSNAIHSYCNLPGYRRFRVSQKMGNSFARDFIR